MNEFLDRNNFDEYVNVKDERAPSYAGILVNDLPQEILDSPHVCGIDTETTLFDLTSPVSIYEQSKPVLFQYYSAKFGPYLIRLGDELPENVYWLLGSAEHVKVMHHALFDMGMLYKRYPTVSINGVQRELGFSAVACTKVAAKLLDPNRTFGPQKLVALVDRYLGIRLNKDEQISDWTQELTESQINYAVADVQYLPVLYERMLAEIDQSGNRTKYDSANRMLMLQMLINLNTDPRVYTY